MLKGVHFKKLVIGGGCGDFLPPAKVRSNRQIAMARDNAMMKTLYGDDLADLNRFASNLAARKNPVEGIIEFIRAKPGISSFVMGVASGGATFGLTGDPTYGVAGMIAGGLARRAAQGRPVGSSHLPSALEKAARLPVPVSPHVQRMGTNVGGTVAANVASTMNGPSLSN